MRFAIKTAPQMTTWADMLAVWQAADEIELFESAWNFDHFEPILGQPRSGPCLEAWTMLAAMAVATKRIRLGCMVTGNVYRHPAVLANMVATTDVISGGRLELGIGAAWNQDECDAYGIELPPLKERFDRFDEACEILVGLLSGEEGSQFSFPGQHYKVTDAWCEPKPVQRPHPPLLIGGNGEKRTLRSVARYAQMWNTPITDAATLEHKRGVLAQHCADLGRDPAEITITVQVRLDPANPSATADQVAELGAAGAQLAIVTFPSPHTPAVLEPLAAALSQVG